MTKLSDEELWDRYQTELRYIYDRKKDVKPIYPLIHLIKKHYKQKSLPLNSCVGEVGFGNGGILEDLSTMFETCYGLDISARNLEFTELQFRKKEIQNVAFVKYNILSPPPNTLRNLFDAVVLCHVLEHFDVDELVILLSNVKALLKPHGVFFGATPYNKAFNPRICPNCGHLFEIDGHKQIFDDSKIEKILSQNGFHVKLVRHFNPEHYYWGESILFKIYHKIIEKKLSTQLEFIAISI